MWDTWLFPWEGRFHLFYLEYPGKIGHAVSGDLLHWQTLETVLLKGPAGSWNRGGTPLTGTVVRHEGRFYMFAGSSMPPGVQVIGVFVSDDLEHWEAHPGNPVLTPRGPHYLACPQPGDPFPADWRDPCIVRDEDGLYHGYLCARLPEWSHEHTGATVAHVVSRDLLSWECLPPIASPGDRLRHAEIPDLFRIGDRYYLF